MNSSLIDNRVDMTHVKPSGEEKKKKRNVVMDNIKKNTASPSKVYNLNSINNNKSVIT